MKQGAIYIPSRQRLWRLPDVVESWAPVGLPIYVVVDPSEADAYDDWFFDNDVDASVVAVSRNNMGIGYARDIALRHSIGQGHAWHIQVDDDIVMSPNLRRLSEPLGTDRVARVSCWVRIHAGWLGIKEGSGFHVHHGAGGLGNCVYAIDNAAAEEVGGFDHSFKTNMEDGEFAVRLLKGGYRIGIHSDVPMRRLGRHMEDPGGIQSNGANEEDRKEQARKVLAKHPDAGSLTAKGGIRMKWKHLADAHSARN